MRCRPGDLAYVSGKEFPENIGAIVRVVEAAQPYEADFGTHYWTCESLGRPLKCMVTVDGQPTGCIEFCIVSDIADRDLRPIRGDQGEDEILRIAGLPQSHNQPEHA